MSKTYKEPEEKTYEEAANEITFNSKPIASALPDDKAFNPQTVLKQYNYFPHPPPHLPGPSVLAEAEQNEMYLEFKRQRSKDESALKKNKESESLSFESLGADAELQSPSLDSEDDMPASSRKLMKPSKTFGKKSSIKVNKPKEREKLPMRRITAPEERAVKVMKDSLVSTDVLPEKSGSTTKLPLLPEMKGTIKPVTKPIVPPFSEALPGSSTKGRASEGVQCTASSAVDKLFIMPPSIHYLIRTLSFLVKELDKSDSEPCQNAPKEVRKLLMQINEAIGALLNHKLDHKFTLQASLSDSKRLQKIYNDLEQYINHVYGKSGKLGTMAEEKKKIYCRLFQKECELQVLNEKLREGSIQHPAIRMSDQMAKPPEVVLQNKDLENEQLQAEIEFNSQEMLKYQESWDLASATDPECLGICYGIIGKIRLDSIVEPRLMLIRDYTTVGEYVDGDVIYKVKSIVFLSPDNSDNINLTLCKKHQASPFSKKVGFFDQKSTFAKTLGAVKSATNSIKTSTQQAAALAMPQVKFKFLSKDKEKFERRILEELHKIFTDTDSFYFSLTNDLTNTLQRRHENDGQNGPLWRSVDDRFFWNKYMLHDLINSNNPLYDPWILPVIQGYVQIEDCKIESGCDIRGNDTLEPKYENFKLILISRRSRHRAGTRYKRRGVDDDGQCANYVETEQILTYQDHKVSFVQTRGSVPVFWSQPGYKYRPPPRLDRGTAENQVVFEKHFERELETYGPVCVVNLVEQSGKEKIIWDAYTSHILAYNHPKITYASFDFHEYCRGMHFENKGVFRINCIDCLDRTNVVQTALAKTVMEIQLTKLGLIVPEGHIPQSVRNTFQFLWANNGDIISKQYAGTNALKGDYTRTGERKFTGLMKDGMNSANRYYLSRFKDAYRQATIDMMLGNEVTEDIFTTEQKQDEEDSSATAEHVKILIEDCKKLLINNPDLIVGSWGLIDADPVTGDPSETEMDTILILTRESYYVGREIQSFNKCFLNCRYDEQIDRVTKYQKIDLKNLKMIELGPISAPTQMSSVFKLNKSSMNNQFCIRIHYTIAGEDGYFHMFRSTNLRFFNNMTVLIKSPEEMLESLKAICETFLVALEIAGLPPVMYTTGRPLDKKKSKVLDPENSCRLGSYLDLGLTQGLTRNVSETQLVALKSAGTKALSNITQQFSKINKLGQSLRRNQPPKLNVGQKEQALPPTFSVESASNSKVSSPTSRRSSDVSEDSYESATLKVSNSLKAKHMHYPSVGILMNNEPRRAQKTGTEVAPVIGNFSLTKVVESDHVTIRQKNPLLHSRTDAFFDPKKLEISFKSYKNSLEAKECADSGKVSLSPSPMTRKLSHSANEIEEEASKKSETTPHLVLTLDKRCNSEKDLTLNMVSSQSENALRSLKTNIANVITSPVSVTKDMLSPFSKFAKGMHNLGANLDPRKLKVHTMEHTYKVSEAHLDEIKRLEERWKNSKTKLIAL
ncbi:UNVERIFIED_CONTAM: hypothetical protein PYX00_004166 [Menopon gallinae]|uniref:SAC domain-containing protein n=1 Tax=Menopon gallinae TaxID=328185 RepID=A0AAW2I2Q6_9NEOP